MSVISDNRDFKLENKICAICSEEGTDENPLIPEYDESGRIYASICDRCLWGMDCFKMNPKNMQRAADFVIKWG